MGEVEFVAKTADKGLGGFLPAVTSWFEETLGEPTQAQRLGWPHIASGRNTLIFAPTGSGKTLAAFLACLDHLWKTPRKTRGVRILYVSPLKALNQDIERNLELPLAGILASAQARGEPLYPLSVGVRSGDTRPADRQKMVRKPPDILISTPESLHLMLTSQAREILRSVSHVIIDEIHALAANKRGTFLALLLERLEAISPGFVRIGLSATQRPLDEVARFLGGRRREVAADGSVRFVPRRVEIVDSGIRKTMDLEVSLPSRGGGPSGESSIWPAIEERLRSLIATHRSTIIFANNRRVVERLTAKLNEPQGDDEGGDEPPALLARSHHGSLSPEVRRQTESLLKDGELPAVVATASLELGIDMGAVDLVCQVESPGGVARGLQRVGRAGHLVGRTSKGRLIAKSSGDLVESAALARAMLDGEVERLKVPVNALDILTQQVVACVAVDTWEVPALFDLVRCAYPYRDLTASAFEGVLRLASGRYRASTIRDLKPRISWDRVRNTLRPLPGTKRLAVTSGGAIPDTGQYPLFLGEGGPRLGELDEEFVLEQRVGGTFVLGSSTWRITAIEPHKVVVAAAEGRSALMPFWRGEGTGRTTELGLAVGRLCRELAEKRDEPGVLPWLVENYRVDEPSARTLLGLISRQMRQAGAVPDDRTILIETFKDPAGETGLAVLTPFGHKRHHALKLVLGAVLRDRLGIEVAGLHADDGVIFRLPGMDHPPLDLFRDLTAEKAIECLRGELATSALFGLRFRQNAGRALLMPRPDPSKRTPLYLQRLRAKDLLQEVRKFPDFPIVVETYRECLDEDLDLPGLSEFLSQVESGAIRVATKTGDIPSPFANELIFEFSRRFLYEWDDPVRAATDRPRPLVDDDDLDSLLHPSSRREGLEPDAIERVETRLRGHNRPPRSSEEMAEALRELGDLTPGELAGPMIKFLSVLESDGRASRISFPSSREPERWISGEEVALYQRAFGDAVGTDGDVAPTVPEEDEDALLSVVRRFFRTRALVSMGDLTSRYPIDSFTASDLLERMEAEGDLVPLGADDGGTEQWADPRNLKEVRSVSVALRRREAVAVTPEAFSAFVARRQGVDPASRLEGEHAVGKVLDQLQGFPATVEAWEREILPRRVADYRPASLDLALAEGSWRWRAESGSQGDPRVAFVARDFAGGWPSQPEDPVDAISAIQAKVEEFFRNRGAAFTEDVAAALGEAPSLVRQALRTLVGLGRITNDRIDVLRSGGELTSESLERSSLADRTSARGRPRLGSYRRPATIRPEGRWSSIEPHNPDPEASLLAWADVLLNRYGVLARETVQFDPWAPPWRDLQPLLARSEMRGELRRGYFVEGMSGIQYALPETAEGLSRPVPLGGEPMILNTLDPANLYGSGAPFDVPLLEGGTARLSRSASNFLVLISGRPVLICEGYGKRLTGLASASEAEVRAAMAKLIGLSGANRRVLKVESYNGIPPTASEAEAWLAEVGFVRDPPGMAYYAGW